MRARFVSMANGFQKPKLPGIPGIDAFRRPHVPHQPMGLRVHRRAAGEPGRTSGSASSAPAPRRCSASRTSAAAAQQLYVFQRTPSSVDVRANRPTDPSGPTRCSPAGSAERIENFQILTAGGQADEDLVADAWTSITRKLPVMRHNSDGSDAAGPEQRGRDIELADFAKMEEVRARVDAIVADRATAEALKPWYG